MIFFTRLYFFIFLVSFYSFYPFLFELVPPDLKNHNVFRKKNKNTFFKEHLRATASDLKGMITKV